MKTIQIFIKILLLLGLVNVHLVQAKDKQVKKYPEKYYRKIASVYDAKEGQQVFEKIHKCTEVEKDKKFFYNVQECIRPFVAPYISQMGLIKVVAWLVRIESPSSPDKCDIDTLTDHPSVTEEGNDIVLCLDFAEAGRSKRAVLFFDKKGNKTFFRGGKY